MKFGKKVRGARQLIRAYLIRQECVYYVGNMIAEMYSTIADPGRPYITQPKTDISAVQKEKQKTTISTDVLVRGGGTNKRPSPDNQK